MSSCESKNSIDRSGKSRKSSTVFKLYRSWSIRWLIRKRLVQRLKPLSRVLLQFLVPDIVGVVNHWVQWIEKRLAIHSSLSTAVLTETSLRWIWRRFDHIARASVWCHCAHVFRDKVGFSEEGLAGVKEVEGKIYAAFLTSLQ